MISSPTNAIICWSTSTPDADAVPAAAAFLREAHVPFKLINTGAVNSLAEAAAALGMKPADIVKTLVVRRGEDDFLFVMVPGDRGMSWPKLRSVLEVKRLSLPDAETAYAVTGYRRGTITPFGSSTAWPVIADIAISAGEISVGSGDPAAAIVVNATTALTALNAQRADISTPLAQ